MENDRIMTWEDLRIQYRTGRSQTVSGTGRSRITAYRTGVMCRAGDLEQEHWCALVKELIAREKEQELYMHLLEFMEKVDHVRKNSQEKELSALSLHTARIFDDEKWIYYIRFNRMFRPQLIDYSRVVCVIPECCNKPAAITQTQFEEGQRNDMSLYCPLCGEWTRFYEAPTMRLEDIYFE